MTSYINQILIDDEQVKSEKFTDQNQTNLSRLLNPLQERIKEFQDASKAAHDLGSSDRDRSVFSEHDPP
jgi:DNA anti-recombination protein RmuC